MFSLRATYAHRSPRLRPRASALLCLPPAACCLLAATGCNNGRQLQSDLYQRELRLQEDEIYRLEDYIEEYQAIIRGYRCEVAELRSQLGGLRSAPAEEVVPLEADPEPDDPDPPSVLGDDDPIEMLPDPTEASRPPAFKPDLNAPATPEPGGEAPAFEPDPLIDTSSATPIEDETPLADSGQDNRAVSALHLDKAAPPSPYPHTPGPIATAAHRASRDARSSIRVAVEAIPTRGPATPELRVLVSEATHAALAGFDGTASVMLTDPNLEGRKRRLALWDFTAAETSDAWGLDPRGGARLELPIQLPTETPTDRPLRLWVRLIDSEGEKRLEVTEVRFTGPNLALATTTPLASSQPPRRLPAADEAPAPTEPLAVQPEPARRVETDAPSDGWKSARSRRVFDAEVQQVGYDAPVGRD